MKRISLAVFSLTMILQLIGCTENQEVSSQAMVLPAAVDASSGVAAPVQFSDSTAVQSASEPPSFSEPSSSTSSSEEANMNHITIELGSKTFSATLADNEAARAFASYLPMTVNMTEMNGQEKFYALPDNLPADFTERPSTIHSGDIFCWSGNTLVLFYATFQNSYGGYVRLGTVDNPAELAAALGSGSAKVTWSLN